MGHQYFAANEARSTKNINASVYSFKQDCLSTESGPPASYVVTVVRTFSSCDFKNGPMTLMYELDLEMKLEHEQDRQTHADGSDRTHYHAAFAGGN